MTQVTRRDIVEGLRQLGVSSGDVILVHSSLKRFGRVEGGVETVIDALLEAVGPNGTVMAPTLTGAADHNAANPPVFDVRETPCWTGIIPETFRQRPEAVRSLHPTHSVAAIGPHAEYLTKDHHTCQTPCGPDSPYLRLVELDGKVVFLGVSLSSCTLLHGVEELAQVDYHMQAEPATAAVTDPSGRVRRVTAYLHLWRTARQYPVLEPILLEEGILTIGKIGDAEIRVLRAKPTVDRVLNILKDQPRFLCKPDEKT